MISTKYLELIMRKITLLAIALLFIVPVVSYAAPIEKCRLVANRLNEGFPLRVGKSTVVQGVGCLPRAVRPILFYRAMIDIALDPVSQEDVEYMKRIQRTGWCTE